MTEALIKKMEIEYEELKKKRFLSLEEVRVRDELKKRLESFTRERKKLIEGFTLKEERNRIPEGDERKSSENFEREMNRELNILHSKNQTKRTMYLTRSEYDRGVNTFSPEGRLFQVRLF